MITSMDVLKFEVKRFKEQEKINNRVSAPTIKNIFWKAFRDSVKMKAFEKGIKYGHLKYNIKKELYDDMKSSFSSGACSEQIFSSLVKSFKNIMTKVNLGVFATDGHGQKFVSMAYKYFYCIDFSKRDLFKDCYLPLDSNTLSWYKTNCINKENIKLLDNIDFDFTRIDEDLYSKIQEDVKYIIESKTIKYDLLGEEIECKVESRLELDFIIWKPKK